MKKIIYLFLFFIILNGLQSCKRETCPTYSESHFLSKKKYNRQIRQYQNGKLIKKIKEKKVKESGDGLKNSKKIQKNPVPKS